MITNLIEKRASKVEEARTVLRRADRAERDLNEDEEAKYEEILAEIESLTKKIDERLIALGKTVGSRSDYSKPENFNQLLEDLEKATDEPIKAFSSFDSDDPEFRVYDKRSLPEFSRRLTGNNNKIRLGKVMRAIITGDTSNLSYEERAAMGTAAGGGSNFIVKELSGTLIPMALNKAQVIKAGAKIVEMKDNQLLIPQLTALPSTEWKAENADFTGADTVAFEGKTLTAKTLLSIAKISQELALDGHNVETAIEDSMSSAIALAVDNALLQGDGVGANPLGIIPTVGILSEDVASVAIANYDHFSSAYYKIEAENGTPNAVILPSSVLEDLDQLKDTANNTLTPPESWKRLQALRGILSSNQLAGTGLMGDFSQLIVGIRNRVMLDVTREAGDSFSRMQVWVRMFTRLDCVLGIKEHFCKLINIV